MYNDELEEYKFDFLLFQYYTFIQDAKVKTLVQECKHKKNQPTGIGWFEYWRLYLLTGNPIDWKLQELSLESRLNEAFP